MGPAACGSSTLDSQCNNWLHFLAIHSRSFPDPGFFFKERISRWACYLTAFVRWQHHLLSHRSCRPLAVSSEFCARRALTSSYYYRYYFGGPRTTSVSGDSLEIHTHLFQQVSLAIRRLVLGAYGASILRAPPPILSTDRRDWFFLRATAGTAIARLSHRNSVRPFVCHTGGSGKNGAS